MSARTTHRALRALSLATAALPFLLGTACVNIEPEATGQARSALSGGLVISQVYGGGGNSSATYTNDFVEIFNLGATAVPLAGLSVQYASATGEFTAPNVVALPSDTVQPGQYYLVGLGSGGANGVALPTPDFSDTGLNLGATAGKVALVDGTTVLPCDAGTCALTGVIDLVGYGATANLFEGSGPATGPSGSGAAANGPSAQRRLAGCTETDDNASDFENPVLTANARNSASPANVCAGDGGGAGDAGAPDADGGGDAISDAALPTDSGGDDASGDDASGDDAGSSDAEPDDAAADSGDAGSDAGAGDAGSDAGSDASVGNTQGLVISQIYGAGGNSGATYNTDFVELFNRGSSPVSLSDLSIQYASATGNFGPATVAPLPAATIPVGHYYLVALATGATGTALPIPDLTSTNLNASASSGKIALAIGSAALDCGGDAGVCASSALVDLVGYGTTASAFEGSGPATPASGSTTAVLRRGGGCIDTRDNSADFENPALSVNPRNSATPFHDCSAVSSDAGPSDAGSGSDSGIPSSDGGLVAPDASVPLDSGNLADATRPDSGSSEFEPSPKNGCSCEAVGASSKAPLQGAALAGFAIALTRLRRRKALPRA